MRLIKVNAIAFAKMMGCLMEGATCKEVAEETGLHYMTALSYIRELHREGAVHVSGWQQDTRGSHTIRVYKVGRRKDAARPVKSRAEVVRRYREKKKRMLEFSKSKLSGFNAFLYGANHDSSGSKKISS
jgi:predicted ArsR family transcriptional regulator